MSSNLPTPKEYMIYNSDNWNTDSDLSWFHYLDGIRPNESWTTLCGLYRRTKIIKSDISKGYCSKCVNILLKNQRVSQRENADK